MLVLRTIILALLSFGTTASSRNTNIALNAMAGNLRGSGPCDESFPLAATPLPPDGNERRLGDRRLVAILRNDEGQYYESGEYYAPLCPDGRHIDVRKLRNCNGGSCFNEFINQCTFECTWNIPTTALPTNRPTPSPTLPPKVTENPLLISLRDLPEKYRMNKKLRKAIIQYIKDRLKIDLKNLGLGMSLIDVTSPGRLPGKPNALPLNVQVVGPPDVSDFALSYIMETTRDANRDIAKYLKQLGEEDGFETNPFQNVSLDINTYNVADILEGYETNPPSFSPTTSLAPSAPLIKPKSASAVIIKAEETADPIPWWVWLIVALVILLCICCCCCYCIRRRRRDDEKDGDVNQGQQINLFMQNRMLPASRPKKQERRPSFESKRTRQSHRRGPPRSIRASDQSRRTTRTTRTRMTNKTRASRPSARSRAPPPEVAMGPTPEIAIAVVPVVREADLETEVSNVEGLRPLPTLDDAVSAVSGLSGGCDPPEEHALVLYNGANPNPQARDPTFYTDRKINPDQVEPEGDKINRKQSMFGDAALMNEVRREREEEEAKKKRRSDRKARKARRSNRRPSMGDRLKQSFKWKRNEQFSEMEPSEDGIEAHGIIEPPEDGIADQRYYESDLGPSEPEGLRSSMLPVPATKKKSKKKKSRTSKKESSSSKPTSRTSKLSASLNWKRTDAPIDIEALESNDSVSDSSSILTNHNPLGMDGQQAQMGASNDWNDDGHHRNNEGHASHSRQSKKKRSKKKEGLFSDIRRKSMDFVRDGVSSDESSMGDFEE